MALFAPFMIPLSAAAVIEVAVRRAVVVHEAGDESICGSVVVVENLALSGQLKCDDL